MLYMPVRLSAQPRIQQQIREKPTKRGKLIKIQLEQCGLDRVDINDAIVQIQMQQFEHQNSLDLMKC